MTTLDQDLKIASEANKFCDDPIAIESDVMDDFFSTFTPEKVKAYIEVAKAARDAELWLDKYHGGVKWLSLTEALKELEK